MSDERHYAVASGPKLTLWGIHLTGKKTSIVLEMLRKAEIASTEFVIGTF